MTFSDEEKVWVDRVAKTKTPDDVLDLAEELYAWMAENSPDSDTDEDGMNIPNPSGMPGDKSDESGDESGDKSDGSGDKSDGSGNFSKEKNDDENVDDSGPNMAGGNNSDCDTDDCDTDDDGTLKGSEEGGEHSSGQSSVPEATTDSAFGKAMDELRDKNAKNRIYAKIPKVDLDKVVISPKKLLEEFGAWYLEKKTEVGHGPLYWDNTLEKVKTLKNDSKNIVSYMVKEFEMKKSADAYARAAVSKTGSLDMNKIHTYKYNEDLFKKVSTLPGATNHGMVMVLDWSGSMYENLLGTMAQMYNLIWFCRRIKIPFEVFAFSDKYEIPDRAYWNKDVNEKYFKSGDMALHKFKLMNFFSSNMTISEEMSMMHILWMFASCHYSARAETGYPYQPPKNLFLGGTPLNDAIIAMMDLVPKFKSDTGVQKVNTVFLTDGASNSLSGVYDYEFDKENNTHTKKITSFPFSRSVATVVLTDPVMNKTYEIENTTNDLLRILKNRVSEMNVIGFFIAGASRNGKISKNTLRYLLPDNDLPTIMEKIKFINKNNYLALNQLGYDEFYILPGGNSLKIENETLNDELIGASKAKLKTAFGKVSKDKISSRQLLNKFVKLVA